MILRKPYAFFIKYFKLFHAIIALIVGVLLYRSLKLYNFFSSYVSDYSSALNDLSPRTLITMYSFLMILLVIILIIILLSVMIYKRKPKSLYIYSLLVYVAIAILYGVTSPTLRDISVNILDIRYSKALRDFYMIALLFQFISLVGFIVRATGFDIKQFDFGSDLQKLDIDEKDSEEIEVALEFDGNRVNRQVRYGLRQFKYVYGENKFLINTVCIILFVILSFVIYFNRSVYTAYYKEGESFEASGVTLNIKNSYLVNTDSSGNKLTDDMIVVVKFDIKKTGSKTLNTGLATLRIGNNSYGQDNDYAKELYDIGTAYTSEQLTDEFETYILAFNIPKEKVDNTMTLKFNDNVSYVKGEIGAKNILVKLDPTDLTVADKTVTNKMGEEIDFDGSILDGTTFKINSYEVNDKFKLSYNYCYGTNKCLTSYEYVTPTATGNYFKTLMKLDASYGTDSDEITDLVTFLNTFGTINYTWHNEHRTKKISTQVITPKTASSQFYYIEVPTDLSEAGQIEIEFKVRNYTYKYTLK